MIDIVVLFCSIDDFWMIFKLEWEKRLLSQGKRPPKRRPSLAESEIMTIVILFHMMGYRNFKTFYIQHVCKYLSSYFHPLPSYNRFLELKRSVVFPMYCYLMENTGMTTGISFVDSTPLAVCHVKRACQHKVFRGLARKGKTSTGWFFGFKLHLMVNDKGDLLSFMLTPGNTDDRAPVLQLFEQANLIGKLFGDRGYISSSLADKLVSKGVQLITRIKKNMKNKLMYLFDKLLLRKRGIIETIIDQLKNISQIEHSRHRSPTNFLVNLFGGLIAYIYQPKKPSLHLDENECKLLAIA